MLDIDLDPRSQRVTRDLVTPLNTESIPHKTANLGAGSGRFGMPLVLFCSLDFFFQPDPSFALFGPLIGCASQEGDGMQHEADDDGHEESRRFGQRRGR